MLVKTMKKQLYVFQSTDRNTHPSFFSFLLCIHHTIKRIGSWSVIYSYKLGLLHASESSDHASIYIQNHRQRYTVPSPIKSLGQIHHLHLVGKHTQIIYVVCSSGVSSMVSKQLAALCPKCSFSSG